MKRQHRRRIKTEEEAKVVASVWGEEFIKFLAALAILPRTILKNSMNSCFSFKFSWCNSSYNSNCPLQNSKRGKEFIKEATTLSFRLSLSFFYERQGFEMFTTISLNRFLFLEKISTAMSFIYIFLSTFIGSQNRSGNSRKIVS